MRWLVSLAVLALLALVIVGPMAWLATTATPTPTPTPTPNPTQTQTPTYTPTATQAGNVAVGAYALNLRECAGVGCRVVGVLERGAVVHLLGASQVTDDGATWRRVTADGLTGWVNQSYLILEVQK